MIDITNSPEIDLFAEGPVLENTDLFDFNKNLEQAVIIGDEVALAALHTSFSRAREAGEFDYMRQMSMVLGATACLHSHLQETSADISKQLFGDAGLKFEDPFGVHADHEDDDEEDEDDQGHRGFVYRTRRRGR